MSATGDVRELRSQMRTWRRGRADTRFVDALSDAYIAVFAVLMLGSMAVNVVLNVRVAATRACTSTGCTDVRTLSPWVVSVVTVTGSLVVARVFGPMLASPATASWLLPSPLDRAALLRTRLAVSALAAAAVGALVTAGTATLAGFLPGVVVLLIGTVAVPCLAAVCFATWAQEQHNRSAQLATWALAAFIWAGLLLLTLDVAPSSAVPQVTWPWLGAVGLGAVGTILLAARAALGLNRLSRGDLALGGSLVPGLSGALATLDLALAHDVLVSRRWRSRSTVHPRRGGPAGLPALLWSEMVRLSRSPQALVTLAGAVVLPYLATTAGLGRVVVLVGVATGFLAGLGLLTGLRVVTRASSLARVLPWPDWQVRAACLALPGAALVLFGLAASPAVHEAMGVDWSSSVVISVAIGVGATTCATRWMTGRPPDYTRPLVSTPAGAVPANLYGSVLRGFDVLLLVTAPLLIAPTSGGAVVSLALSAIVLSVLLGRR